MVEKVRAAASCCILTFAAGCSYPTGIVSNFLFLERFTLLTPPLRYLRHILRCRHTDRGGGGVSAGGAVAVLGDASWILGKGGGEVAWVLIGIEVDLVVVVVADLLYLLQSCRCGQPAIGLGLVHRLQVGVQDHLVGSGFLVVDYDLGGGGSAKAAAASH